MFGKGCLGTEVGRLAELLGMKVLYAEHRNATTCREGYTPLEEVLKTGRYSDIALCID